MVPTHETITTDGEMFEQSLRKIFHGVWYFAYAEQKRYGNEGFMNVALVI